MLLASPAAWVFSSIFLSAMFLTRSAAGLNAEVLVAVFLVIVRSIVEMLYVFVDEKRRGSCRCTTLIFRYW